MGLNGLLLLSDDPQESREQVLSALDGKQADYVVTTNLSSIPIGVLRRTTEIAPLEQRRTPFKEYPWVSELLKSASEVLVVAFSIKSTVDTYRRQSVHGSKKVYDITSERFLDLIGNTESYEDPFETPPSLVFLHGLSTRLNEYLGILDTEKRIKKSEIESIKEVIEYGNRELTKYDLIEVDKKQIRTSLEADSEQHFKRAIRLLNSESKDPKDNIIACASGFQLLWKGLEFPDNPTEFEMVFHEAVIGGLIKCLKDKDISSSIKNMPDELKNFLILRLNQANNWVTNRYSLENDGTRVKRLFKMAHQLEMIAMNPLAQSE